MSFNAKNLSYASNEPAFLRKLRGDYGDRDSSRHERPVARPRKQVQEGEDDDQPTYVVEDSQDTLSKAEYEALVAADTANKDENNVPLSAKAGHVIEEAEPRKGEVAGEAAPVKQAVAGIGGSTKRRLAKVVGDEGEDKAASEDCVSGKNSNTSRVKKGKKMKLSYDDEGTEP